MHVLSTPYFTVHVHMYVHTLYNCVLTGSVVLVSKNLISVSYGYLNDNIS